MLALKILNVLIKFYFYKWKFKFLLSSTATSAPLKQYKKYKSSLVWITKQLRICIKKAEHEKKRTIVFHFADNGQLLTPFCFQKHKKEKYSLRRPLKTLASWLCFKIIRTSSTKFITKGCFSSLLTFCNKAPRVATPWEWMRFSWLTWCLWIKCFIIKMKVAIMFFSRRASAEQNNSSKSYGLSLDHCIKIEGKE